MKKESRKAKKTVAIINAIESGATNQEIAKKFGVTLQAIYNIKYNMKKGAKKSKQTSDTNSIAQQTRTIKELTDSNNKLYADRTNIAMQANALLKEIGDQAAVINYLERKIETLLIQQFNNQLKGE